jgi:hypothetical protein
VKKHSAATRTISVLWLWLAAAIQGLLAWRLIYLVLGAYAASGPNDPTAHQLDTVALVICLILILGAIVSVFDGGRTKLLAFTVMATSVVLFAALVLPYIIGGFQDAANVRCEGFFGVQESCVSSWQFLPVLLFASFPAMLVAWPIALLMPILLVIGSWKALFVRK